MYFVYVLRCVDSSLYCGYTTDVRRRLKAHAGVVAGGAKYTKSHPPLGVECVWSTESKEAALRLEFYFKRLKKADKEKFVSGDYSLEVFFGEKFDISEYRRASEFEGDISEV